MAPTVAGQSARLVVGGSGTSPVYEANNAGTAASAAAVNWTAVPVGPGFTSVNGSSAFSPVVPSNQTIVAGGVLNGVANPDVLFVASGSLVFVRSTAGGTLTATPTAFPGGTIRAIALDPSNWRHAFVADASSVYETTDAGMTWLNRTPTPDTLSDIRSLAYVPGTGGSSDVVLAGAQGGVFRMSTSARLLDRIRSGNA